MNAVHLALHALYRTLGTTLVAALTLGLGIASCAAVFAVTNATVLRDLPFADSGRLVWIENAGTGGMSAITSRVDTLLAWREQSQALEGIAAYFAFFEFEQYTLVDRGEPLRLRAVRVSQDFLDVLGVQPAAGRNFTPEEAEWNQGNPGAVLLSYAFWQRRFGGDAGIVGATVSLNDRPATVVGVLPRELDFSSVFAPASRVDVLVPFALTEQTANWGNTLFGIGRLTPGATPEQAASELDAINARVAELRPDRDRPGARVSMLEDHIRGDMRRALLLLAAAVGCVMLIACVNVSSLLLARANARRQEVSLRTALGATRWHLLRQLLVESAVLTCIGSILGVALAWTVLRALVGIDGLALPLLGNSSLDVATVVFTVCLAAVISLAASALPAALVWRAGTGAPPRGASASGGGARVTATAPRMLVVVQIALTCLLLVCAGLLTRSFVGVLGVELGFEPENTIAWRAGTSRSFTSAAERVTYFERLLEHARAVPGVESAGFSDTLPLGRNRTWGIALPGAPIRQGQGYSASIRIIDAGYLPTMRIPLISGRLFDSRDHVGSAPTIILGQTTAQTLWPEQDGLGKTVLIGGGEHTVVGIVADVPRALEEAPEADVYLNYQQVRDWSSLELIVRSSRAPESIVPDMRAAIAEFDPEMASNEHTTLTSLVDRAVAPRQLTMLVLVGFSLFALLLAAIGLYSAIAYSVTRRTREMGVRMALGARTRGVLMLVLGEGARMALLGIAAGLLAAWLAGRLMESLLFGVAPSDPLTFAVNALLVVSIALLATLVPALRAARTQPTAALRYE